MTEIDSFMVSMHSFCTVCVEKSTVFIQAGGARCNIQVSVRPLISYFYVMPVKYFYTRSACFLKIKIHLSFTCTLPGRYTILNVFKSEKTSIIANVFSYTTLYNYTSVEVRPLFADPWKTVFFVCTACIFWFYAQCAHFKNRKIFFATTARTPSGRIFELQILK